MPTMHIFPTLSFDTPARYVPFGISRWC